MKHVRYKLRCAATNKCKSCPRQNDNPTSFVCLRCTNAHRMYQRTRLARLRATNPTQYQRVQAQWRTATAAHRRAA